MKKEGTGKPWHPDIALGANVRMRELHFEKVPQTEVRFRGNTRRNSMSETERENLPEEVHEGVVYRDAGVRVQIASESADSNPNFLNRLEEARVRTSLDNPGRKTGEQGRKSREERE